MHRRLARRPEIRLPDVYPLTTWLNQARHDQVIRQANGNDRA